MNFEDVKFDESGPIYLQVVSYIKRQVLTGLLKDGEEMPSRRTMAALLGLNLTTIQKIYKQLEDEGMINTEPNSKTYVTISDEKLHEIENELIVCEIKKTVYKLKECRATKETTIDLINHFWEV